MTVYNGPFGTVCFFFKGLLISSFPLSNKKTLDRYLYQGTALIKSSKHVNIKTQIEGYEAYCNVIYERKLNKQPIHRRDHIMFLNCLSALMRLKKIDNDEQNGYMCFPKKIK